MFFAQSQISSYLTVLQGIAKLAQQKCKKTYVQKELLTLWSIRSRWIKPRGFGRILGTSKSMIWRFGCTNWWWDIAEKTKCELVQGQVWRDWVYGVWGHDQVFDRPGANCFLFCFHPESSKKSHFFRCQPDHRALANQSTAMVRGSGALGTSRTVVPKNAMFWRCKISAVEHGRCRILCLRLVLSPKVLWSMGSWKWSLK